MEIFQLIKQRHSIRKYKDTQISRKDLEKILEAGSYAPNAGGGQRTILVGIRNKELTTKIGYMNLAKFDRSNLTGSYVSKEQPSLIDDPSRQLLSNLFCNSWIYCWRTARKQTQKTWTSKNS